MVHWQRRLVKLEFCGTHTRCATLNINTRSGSQCSLRLVVAVGWHTCRKVCSLRLVAATWHTTVLEADSAACLVSCNAHVLASKGVAHPILTTLNAIHIERTFHRLHTQDWKQDHVRHYKNVVCTSDCRSCTGKFQNGWWNDFVRLLHALDILIIIN